MYPTTTQSPAGPFVGKSHQQHFLIPQFILNDVFKQSLNVVPVDPNYFALFLSLSVKSPPLVLAVISAPPAVDVSVIVCCCAARCSHS